jgi:signal peptidase II
MSRVRRAVLFVAIFLSSAGFDQGSKEWARATLPAHVPQPVVHGYWDWQLEQNPGAAFSTFIGGGTVARVALSLVALIALIALGVIAARTRPDERLKRVALALIAGGALGNLVDRVVHGSVTDFVRWHVHDHMWPVFNLADAFLLVGVGLLGLERALAHRAKSRDRPSTA